MEKTKTFCHFSTLLLSLAFLVLLSACTADGKDNTDISSLEIKNTSQVCEPIDLEAAIKLEAKVTASIDRYAEENLKELEDEVLKETGKGVQYYQFTGTFSVEGIEDLQGKLTTLIVVVDDDTRPYIYDVRVPVSEVEGEQDLQWTQLDASASIDAEKKSARVAAMGYVTIEAGSDSEKDSNTLYPEFMVSLP